MPADWPFTWRALIGEHAVADQEDLFALAVERHAGAARVRSELIVLEQIAVGLQHLLARRRADAGCDEELAGIGIVVEREFCDRATSESEGPAQFLALGLGLLDVEDRCQLDQHLADLVISSDHIAPQFTLSLAQAHFEPAFSKRSLQIT
ncbi:MAG: hypothetical protein AAFV62_14065 [Pseudomonadota bacterium]